MTEEEIQKAANAISADMVARGLKSPDCIAMIRAQAEPQIYLHWEEDGVTYGRTEIGRGVSVREAITEAEAILSAIPPKAERDRAEFTRLLANVIDKGRDIGIEVEFVNPLVETMKRLSENAITHVAA